MNKSVNLAAAQAITSIDKLLEVIVAPSFEADALQLLRDRWKNVRLLAVGALGHTDVDDFNMHKIAGGYLLQQRDLAGMPEMQVVSKRKPTDAEMTDLQIAWLACKHVKSNAIVIAKDQATVGIGGGQVDRVNAVPASLSKKPEIKR